jgi:DNA-binding transcriptional MerR regulator
MRSARRDLIPRRDRDAVPRTSSEDEDMDAYENEGGPRAVGFQAANGLDAEPYLSIGDFSRATHMSLKMLRHYHQIGLLEPASVDPDNGYRRYTADQIPTARMIRRFRQLQMPLDRIRDVLAAPDPVTRRAMIAAHLNALQASLAETQAVVASVRSLLEAGSSVTRRESLHSRRRVAC